jgi:hypothetical protein
MKGCSRETVAMSPISKCQVVSSTLQCGPCHRGDDRRRRDQPAVLRHGHP